MILRMLKKLTTKQSLFAIILALGASVTLGFLSFAGVLAIPFLATLGCGIAAFFLAAMYEGQIFHRNLSTAYEKLFVKDSNKQEVADHYLEHLAYDESNRRQSVFLQNYYQQLRYVKALREYEHLDDEGEKKREAAELRLKLMQQYFMKYVFGDYQNESTLIKQLDSFITPEKKTKLAGKAQKQKNTRRGIFAFSNVVGLSVGLASITTFLASLKVLSITGAAASGILFPGISIAAAAYTFLMYNAITDFFLNDRVREGIETVKEAFTEASGPKAVAMAFGVGFVVLLGIAVTLATAGTWWTLSINAIKHLPKLIPAIGSATTTVAGVFAGTGAAFYSIATFLFNIENTTETIEVLGKIFKNFNFKVFVRNAWDKFMEVDHTQTTWQRYNPFRFITQTILLPLRILTFIGHVASMGVTTDNVSFVPEKFNWITATVCTTAEFGEEFHYNIQGDSEEQEGHDHDHDGGHDHDHANIPVLIIKTVLLIIPIFYIASAAWDSIASQSHKDPEQRRTFKESLYHALGIKQQVLPKHTVPKMSGIWMKEEREAKIESEMERFDSGFLSHRRMTERGSESSAKRDVFQALRSETQAMPAEDIKVDRYGDIVQGVLTKTSTDGITYGEQLGRHRNRFFSLDNTTPTHSLRFFDELAHDSDDMLSEMHTLPMADVAA